jgi:hypothetical protein
MYGCRCAAPQAKPNRPRSCSNTQQVTEMPCTTISTANWWPPRLPLSALGGRRRRLRRHPGVLP